MTTDPQLDKQEPFKGFDPNGVFFSKRSYLPKLHIDIGQEAMAIKFALMDLGEIVPFAFFHPRYIYVTRNAYLGEDRFVVVPSSPAVTIIALYVPLSIQNAWLLESLRQKPDQVIEGVVENFLREQFRRYTEEI